MEEEKKEEQTPVEETTAIENAAKTMVDKANEAAERLEAANEAHEKLVKREEAAKVQARLGGKTEAGEKQEESAVAYKDRVMANEEGE